MAIHQCPRCDLRFADMPEVVQHLIDDHDIAPEVLERRLSGLTEGVHPRRQAPDPVHIERGVDKEILAARRAGSGGW